MSMPTPSAPAGIMVALTKQQLKRSLAVALLMMGLIRRRPTRKCGAKKL
jgi:hypothetical protein